MACNHCDDPVCLKGCPTRAYTKFAEYGAVLQDPDICFGCGYCTWVCPYNAPQLDPVKGQVSKCNMCVDRLEAGLKPACVSACLGGALDFGVVENSPPGRDQAKLDIPGFPDPSITRPNIRFQQQRPLPLELTRTDSMQVKYRREGDAGYHSELDMKEGVERHWNWRRLLGSHENSHILFTLCTQAVLGAFLLLALSPWFSAAGIGALAGSAVQLPLLALLLLGLGMFKLNMHLGKPHRFYRGFNNLRYSPVSREIAGVTLFFASLVGYSFFSLFDNAFTDLLAAVMAFTGSIGGLLGLWFMYRIYRVKARPYWDHWQTAASFFGSTLSLGALLTGSVSLLVLGAQQTPLQPLALAALLGLLLEAVGLLVHAHDLRCGRGEGAAAHYEQCTRYGWPYLLRNVLLGVGLLLALPLALGMGESNIAAVQFVMLALTTLVMAIIGRALFYVIVIPTTLPGAFFWRNRAFVEHARETGMAEMPQVGVVYERHHRFQLGELVATIRQATPQQLRDHLREILLWR